jgi:hypothetical protein
MNTIVKPWVRCAGNLIPAICLAACFALNLPAAFAQSSVIHVHESGGAVALNQALTNVAEPGTIYVHSGTYDLGATANSFLTISKAVSIVGFDDGTGKPVIKGARPSGTGLLVVNAPDKAVVLDKLVLSFYGIRPPNTNTAVQVLGSNGFTVRDCTINAAFFDGTRNQGLYSSISIAGPAQSEFPVLPYPPTATSAPNPNYALRNNVRGAVKIQNSIMTSLVTGGAIGFFGPVRLDTIELSNCTFNSLGATFYGDGNRGNIGFMITQYPVYMSDANRSSLIEAARTETRTLIQNNTITASNPLYLFYLKGVQRVEKNRLHSASAWWDGSVSKYMQLGIMAVGYPHDPSDPTTYSEAVIRDNVIVLHVPLFPLAAYSSTPSRPAQTSSNTFPATAIWLGESARFAYPASSIVGHYAKATVTGNILSSPAFSASGSASGPPNAPDFGLHLRGKTKNCTVAGNHLAGGWLVDPIDGRAKHFEPFTAKIAQLYVGREAQDNYFGPVTRHRWLEDSFDADTITSEHGEGWGRQHLPGNAFGPAGIVGVWCYGQNNQFRENRFWGNYAGWEPGDGPGLFWLTDTTYRNRIEMTRLNGRGLLFNLCRQIYDETDWGWNRYQGLNSIQGFGRCHPKSADFSQRMQTLKASIEARLGS